MRPMILCLLAVTAATQPLVEGGRRPSQLDLLRGFVNARCLAALYRGNDAGNDADRAAMIYLEVSHEMRSGVYDAADALAKSTAATVPPRDAAGGIGVMVCLELAESAAVADIARGRPVSHPFRLPARGATVHYPD